VQLIKQILSLDIEVACITLQEVLLMLVVMTDNLGTVIKLTILCWGIELIHKLPFPS
jgi:hypothetical protein